MMSRAHKGKMHRLKNAPPRQWPMPPRTLTVEQFRQLSRRRDRQQNVNPNSGGSIEEKKEEEELKEREEVGAIPDDKSKGSAADLDELDISNLDGKVKVSKATGVKESDIRTNDGREEVVSTWTADKEQRRLEVEKKLTAAKEKKHNLVQMLKMILNAEEEIKRRNGQSVATQTSVATQGETTADMGSASRLVPKLSVEVNFSGDQGTESDATACHSSHGQQVTKPFMPNMPRSSLATSGEATTRPSVFAPSPGASGGASVSNFKDTRRTASSS